MFQLFARITKLGWFDIQDKDYVFRNVVTDVTKFIQVGIHSQKQLNVVDQKKTLNLIFRSFIILMSDFCYKWKNFKINGNLIW